MPRELGDRDVHAEADAEVRDAPLARDPAGEDLPLPAARAEAAGDEHAVDALEQLGRLVVRHVLGVDPAHADRAAVVEPGVLERLVHREVGVLELHVLADERDLDDVARRSSIRSSQLVPLAEVRLAELEAELLADEPVEPLRLEHARARGRRPARPGSR